ncbi:hypothetical protein [uncultured Paraglaciecola sp.]|uniref:hypothetical protein n=1 Tax=uncultured Paraglaciecola sp. TaxID=1765024 RepID=UPI002625C8DA|nr:hypothetical protein [uncultured Paraglaciecola sp.]
MTIAMTVVTTTAQILDANGANGFGTVTVAPTQASTYFDGVSTISVTNNAIIENVIDGRLENPLVLSPTSNATNSPEVNYIVDIRVNGTYERILWSLPAPASTTEFSNVARVSSTESVSDEINAILQAANPLPQYVLRSDTATAPVASAASDGKGYIPRCDTANGKIPTSFITGTGGITASDIPVVDTGGYFTTDNVEAALQQLGADAATLPSGTRMIFQQWTAPTGWTRETGSAYHSAFGAIASASFTVGAGDTGGTSDVRSSHTHTINHGHSGSTVDVPSLGVTGTATSIDEGGGTSYNVVIAGSTGASVDTGDTVAENNVSLDIATHSGSSGSYSPKWFSQIIAVKN